MQRAITGFEVDEEGDWVAELSCGHGQHVRHRPPFQTRGWVLDAEGRHDRLGAPLDCPLCDRAELPDGLTVVRTSPEWDEKTMPVGLTRAHRLAAGTWGRIVVHEGQLRFAARTDRELRVVVSSGSTQAIPPEVDHDVQALDRVRFSIDFLSVREEHPGPKDEIIQQVPGQGGETACFAHLVCQGCGAVLDGGPHVAGCGSAAPMA